MMWGAALCGVAAAIVLVWGMNDEKMVEGQWNLNNVLSCPDSDKYKYNIIGKKTKINRTHDWINAYVALDDVITQDSHGAYVEFCKKMDGGCKLQYTLSPSSVCEFGKQFGGNNFEDILSNLEVENADCPIPKGELNLTNYMVDYGQMPLNAMPGDYMVTGYLTKGYERLLCIMLDMTFTKADEDE